MTVGGGFARFSRMPPPPRKEGDAVESVVKETPGGSENDDSKVDSNMQPWTDSIVDEAPNCSEDDFGLPMDNLGGGMDFDDSVDDSMIGGWGETEVCNVTTKCEALSVDLLLTLASHFSTAI